MQSALHREPAGWTLHDDEGLRGSILRTAAALDRSDVTARHGLRLRPDPLLTILNSRLAGSFGLFSSLCALYHSGNCVT